MMSQTIVERAEEISILVEGSLICRKTKEKEENIYKKDESVSEFRKS